MALGGAVMDLCWDAEGKRILAVGGGNATARVISWDTGSQLGTVMKHEKIALTGALKPERPLRCVYGGSDIATGMSFCKGPPFKYDHALKEHDNFVNCIRYSPNGEMFVSVSSDKTGVVYDGKEGTVMHKLDSKAGHKGSVYCVSWSPDSTKLVTSAADKTLKFWNAADGSNTGSVALGKDQGDMQNSVVWANEGTVVSLSLSGALNVIPEGAEGPSKVIYGHKAPATALAYDASTDRIVSGDIEGRVIVWTATNDDKTQFEGAIVSGGEGEGHKGKVSHVVAAGGKFATAGFDDTLRFGDAGDASFTAAAPLAGQARGVSVSPAAPDFVVVVTAAQVAVYSAGAEVAAVEAAYGPKCVHVSRAAGSDLLVAVGGEDKLVHFYKMNASTGALTEDGVNKTPLNSAVNSVAISPDASKVAAADSTKEIKLIDATGERENIVSGRWTKHATKPVALDWNADGSVLASVAADRRMAFWTPAKTTTALQSRDLAHFQPFTGMVWAGNHQAVWSVGSDGTLIRSDAPSA